MKLDNGKSAVQNVLDLLNLVNGRKLTLSDVELLTPVTVPADADGCNTELTVRAKGRFTHTGSVTFRYKRFNPPVIPAGSLLKDNTGTLSKAALLEKLAALHKFHPEAFTVMGEVANPKAEGNGLTRRVILRVKDAGQYLYTAGDSAVDVETNDPAVSRRYGMLYGARY